ncbi:MAG: thiamine-phosphate kinase [Alphaproteobacteria bacterium]|jgi:thiamine-monophosphate kinase|nr:thiamine-phosphate kinase [Alphaproteobacteria bacterium]
MSSDKKPDEFELIARFFTPLAKGETGALGLGDDAAVLTPPPNRQLVVTTDGLVEGVHFPTGEDPGHVAARLIGVNLSDLAAMGAEPWVYTLALALPEDWEPDWLAAFSRELQKQQDTFAIHLVGGDTTRTTGPMTLSLTAMGTVETGQGLRRGGASAGDGIYVSGTIGDAALGLRVLQEGIEGLDAIHGDALLASYHRPQPRVQLGRRLNGLATAAVDISDGLIADLGHLAHESGLAAEINAAQVPLSEAARSALSLNPDLMELALTGGDDYELLFSASQAVAVKIATLCNDLGLAITPIGVVTDSFGDPGMVRVLGNDGQVLPINQGGYRHF